MYVCRGGCGGAVDAVVVVFMLPRGAAPRGVDGAVSAPPPALFFYTFWVMWCLSCLGCMCFIFGLFFSLFFRLCYFLFFVLFCFVFLFFSFLVKLINPLQL